MENLEQKLKQKCTATKAFHYRALCEVARYIVLNGPLVKTQQAGQVYINYKNLEKKKMSSEYYEIFSKHLNLIQLYIFDIAYLLPNNTSGNMESFIETIKESINCETMMHTTIMQRLEKLFQPALQYMDSHRDRQVVKALFAELTSVKFTAKLQGIKSRQGTASAKSSLRPNLEKYSNIRQTSQVVRSDLTNSQQYSLTQRIISSRKMKEIKTIADGRG